MSIKNPYSFVLFSLTKKFYRRGGWWEVTLSTQCRQDIFFFSMFSFHVLKLSSVPSTLFFLAFSYTYLYKIVKTQRAYFNPSKKTVLRVELISFQYRLPLDDFIHACIQHMHVTYISMYVRVNVCYRLFLILSIGFETIGEEGSTLRRHESQYMLSKFVVL
jgi:hypothetical protein